MLQQSLVDHYSPRSHAMSAECEGLPPQGLGSKPLAPTPPITSTPSAIQERRGSSGISYEGRVSVIPPLAGYEATMRAAMELDRPHTRDQRILSPVDAPCPDSSERHFNHMELDLRRLYEQRMRMKEAAEYELRQAYGQPLPPFLQPPPDLIHIKSMERPSTYVLPHAENGNQQNSPTGNGKKYDNGNSKDANNSDSDQHNECKIKEEPKLMEETVGSSSTQEPRCSFEQETVLRFARTSDLQATSHTSPIQKAGDSPDLPVDSARIKGHASEEMRENFSEFESTSKHNESMEAISPYGESYAGSDDRMPSSVEPDPDDSMDSSAVMGDDMDPLSRLQHALERSGVMNNKDDGEEGPQVFQCHLCSYTGSSRFHFNAHLNTHYDHKCTRCEFTTRTEHQLKEHMQEEHGMSPESLEEIEGIRVPRVNAQGKMKTFKCKQCEYVAITKGDFWAHARSHIKSEKLLTCPKCPFVTEYKHHLEYHLRNHFGSKPYKCNKCNYSCVNKSMLNSHMKSHSNIYQYRCSDCTYATKYCHSLKLHLRKYGHSPAMVLNPDGTPNPVPIIDVYGTRRGPKMKKDDNGMPIIPPHIHLHAQILKAHLDNTGHTPAPEISPHDSPVKVPQSMNSLGPTAPPIGVPQLSPFPYPYPMINPHYKNSSPILSRALEKSPEDAGISRQFEGREQLRELLMERDRNAQRNVPLHKCPVCDYLTPHREILSQHMMFHGPSDRRMVPEVEERPHSPQAEPRPSTPDISSSQHQSPNLTPPNDNSPYTSLAAVQLKEYIARAMNPFLYQQMMVGQIHPALGLHHHLQRLSHPVMPAPHPCRATPPQLPEDNGRINASPQPSPLPSIHHELESALDLSKEHTPPQQVITALPSTSPSPMQLSSNPSSSPTRSETSTPPSKNRRKGRAFKLERIALRLSESAEGESSGHDEELRKEERRAIENRLPPLMPIEAGDQILLSEEPEWPKAFQCQYCDMAFKDVVMYTMHMGYHGYRNPFTCNMCGHQASDKVAFFLHIARNSHA